MSLTSRLLGVRAAQPAARNTDNGRAPKGGSSNVWWSSPGQPQIPEWDGLTAIRNGYQASIYIMQPVRIIATALGSLPIRVGADPDKRNDYDPAAPLARLIGPPPGGPNPVTSPRNLMIWSIIQRLITGRMAWETVCPPGSATPTALWPLVSAFLQPIPSARGTARWFDGYNYQIPSEGGGIPYRPDEVFYSWRPAQHDWRQPESALQAASMPTSLQIALDRYMWALAKNGLAARKLVITPDFAEDDERRAWEDQFASEFTGYDNGGRVLHGYYEDDPQATATGNRTPPIQVVDLASTPADAQVLQILDAVKNDMLRTWRVPMSWLGDASERCLRQTEWVRLADGSRRQARDLAGTSFRLLTATENGQVAVDARAEWESTCEVFRVTTESGRTLEVNGNHPLYAGLYDTAKAHAARNACRKRSTVTPLGWTPVNQLRGDAAHGAWVVAVPTRFHQQHVPGAGLTEDEAFVVGALVGDGSISQPNCSPKLTTPDGDFAKEFIRAVEAVGDDVVRYATTGRVAAWGTRGRQENRKGRGSKGCNQTRALLDRLGLLGTTSRTKFVPDEVFTSSAAAQLAFLSGLFAADGSVSKQGNTRGVTLCTVNRRLAADVQELLLRVGICSRITSGSCTGGIGSTVGVRRVYFTVAVNATEDLRRLCDLLPIPGKQDRLDALCEALPAVPRRNDWRRQSLMPQLRWEQVVSVESLGIDRTVGIQVPDHHTYLGTFFEHNTYENASQEAKNFWQGPVLEAAAEVADDVNMYLAPRFNDSNVSWFDFSGVEALKGTSIFGPIDPVAAHKEGIITAEDWRNDVGLPPLPGDNAVVEQEALPAIDDTPGGSSKANFTRAAADTKLVAAGLCVKALDTGRVLLLQRSMSDDDPAAGTWEFPGGKLDPDEDPFAAAVREWQEEVGCSLPQGSVAGSWTSPNGVYRGFVYLVKSEALVTCNLDHEDRHVLNPDDPDGDQIEVVAWWNPAQLPAMSALRPEARKGTDWHLIATAGNDRAALLECGHRAGTCTGPGPCDTTPFGAGANWVNKAGGLPPYIRAIAHSLARSGHTEASAIATAVATVKRWAAGEANVTEATRARAAKALAQWEALKAKAHTTPNQRDAVMESGSAGLLIPKANPSLSAIQRHVYAAAKTDRRKCRICGHGVTAAPHRLPSKPRHKRGDRHAGPGHAPVKTGHHTARRKAALAAVHRQADSLEPAMTTAMAGLFAQQRKATLDRLNGRRGSQMLRAVQQPPEPPDGTQPQQPAPLVDAGQVFDLTHWVAKTRAALEPTFAAVVSLTADRFGQQLGEHETKSSLAAVRQVLDNRLARLAQTVSRTTFDQVAQVLRDGVAQGQTVQQMTAALTKVFDDAEKNRSPMVARTEVIGSLNQAADSYATAAGPDLVAGKEWLSAHDNRVRHTHAEADGQVRAIGMPFEVGGYPMAFPGDPAAPPSEVINCRCAVAHLTPAEYAQHTRPASVAA